MGKVVLDLKEYDELKRQADIGEEARKFFTLKKNYNGNITLTMNVGNGIEIFKSMFGSSPYNNGKYEIKYEDEKLDYDVNVLEYYVMAVKKEEGTQEEEIK